MKEMLLLVMQNGNKLQLEFHVQLFLSCNDAF